jgi:hypothetical protein
MGRLSNTSIEERFGMSMTWGLIRLGCQKWGEDVDLDMLDQFMQGRYQAILDAHPWKALDKNGTIVTALGTAGTRSLFALPTDLKILLEVNNLAQNFPMRPYTQAELNLLYPGRLDVAGVSGAPQPFIYSMAEDTAGPPPIHQVELYPIPGGTVTHPIRYTQIPATFDPTATTLSPLPWIPPHIIINGVRADILALKKDYQGMMAFETLFTGGINEMLRGELHRQPNARVSELARYQGPATFPMPPGDRRG